MTRSSSPFFRAGLILVAALGLCAPAAAGADGLPGVTGRDKLYDVDTAGDQVWIVGFPGIVLHSANGGRTFEKQGPGGTTAWLAVDFTDSNHGVVVGRGGKALVTGDGGKTWAAHKTGSGEPLFDLSCPDRDHCYAVGNFAAALASADGGRTWKPMQVVDEGEDTSLNGVFFSDARTGYVVGEFGLVARTADGGATWQRVDDGMNADNNFGVTVLDDGTVVVVGSYGLIQAGSVNAGDETAGAAEEGTESGADGEYAAPVEADPEPAMTFVTMESGTKAHLFRVTASKSGLVAVGDAGTLLTAPGKDGAWTLVHTPTFQWLAMALVTDDGSGFALGGRGTFLVTGDGGKSWKKWGSK